MRHKYLTVILTLFIISFTCIIAQAHISGDVDFDGIVTSSDARLVLRNAVKLEVFTDEQILLADTDNSGDITAADARSILRASVAIDTIPLHEYSEWENDASATCSATGTDKRICSCGHIETRVLPMLLHTPVNGICSQCSAVCEDEIVLPKLCFEGNISEMNSKNDVRNIEISYTSEKMSFTGYATLKVQGTSSLAYNKKNYNISFYKDSNFEDKMNVDVGWGAQNKYCLKANWIDKTHSRNIVTANIFTEVQQKYEMFPDSPANNAIDGFPIEIYSNGEFLGLYTFNIPKDAWMFNMDEDNPDHIVFCGEGYEEANFFCAPATYDTWALEVGDETDEKLGKLNTLISFVMTSSDEEFRNNFEQHLNLDAMLNYYILCEFAYLRDNQAKNLLLVTYDGSLWYPSLYDLDTSWGAHWTGQSLFDYEQEQIPFELNKLWSRFINLFDEEIRMRYSELRSDILTKEHVMELFEEFKASIPEETFTKETEKWGTEIPGYDLSQIEEFLNYRIPVLDEKFAPVTETE